MFPIPGSTLADKLSWIADCFRRAIKAEPRPARIGSLSIAVWMRVTGLERRFSALYARWQAGTLATGVRKDTSPRPTGSSPVAAPQSPQSGEREGSAPTPALPRSAGEGADSAVRARAPFDPHAHDAA